MTYLAATAWFRRFCRASAFFLLCHMLFGSLRLAYGQAADLAPTPDANSTDPYITQQAAALNHDPAQIFAFVRDQIAYEAYKGSLRGARGTLWSKAGNALDKASLMIALLRASNIPARYVKGELSEADAQTLILSMFPAPLRAVGCLEPGTLLANPADDPALLAETKEHYWVQFGAGNTDADPSFSGATLGQTFAVSQGTFTEVSDNLRHKVVVRLQAELAGSFTSQLGLPPDVQTPLNQTFNAVELVGKPLSVGHFVNSNAIGALFFSSTTHTYSPYILLGQGDADLSDDPLIRGTDYQEFFSNFGGFSQIITGVFLHIDVVDPDGQSQTFERTLVDRIGFAARQNSGAGSSSVVTPGESSLSELDLVTITVLPGLLSPFAVQPQLDRAIAKRDELTALQPLLADIPASGPQTDTQRTVLAQAVAVEKELALTLNETNGSMFALAADRLLGQLQKGYLTKAYYASPRLVLSQMKRNGSALRAVLDLRKNDVRTLPFPGQATNVILFFEVMRGLMEGALEGEIVAAVTGQATVSIADVFKEAPGELPLTVLAPDTVQDLAPLPLSAEAKARIALALNAGKSVVTPTQMVSVNGTPTIGWLETDWRTGRTISVMEDGAHGAITEYANILSLTLNSPLNASMAAFIGTMHGWTSTMISFTGEFIGNIVTGGTLEEIIKKVKEKIAADILPKALDAALGIKVGPLQLMDAGKKAWGCFQGTLDAQSGEFVGIAKCLKDIAKTVLGLGAMGSGLTSELETAYKGGVVVGMGIGLIWISRNFPGDPPVFPFLSTDLAPGPAPIAPGAQPGVSVQLISDSLFTVSVGNAQLPSVFLAQIRNTGPVTDTFVLNFTGVPAGFTARSSLASVTIPPGHMAEIGICLQPTGDLLDPPNTAVPFTLEVDSTTNGAVHTTDSDQVTTPTIQEVVLASEPQRISTHPDDTVETTLKLAAGGNVPVTVSLQAAAPSGVTVNGLPASVDLAPGETRSILLAFVIAGNVALNQTLDLTISGEIGGAPEPNERTTDILLDIRSQEVAAVNAATQVAADKGNASLASVLAALGDAFAQLQADPENATLCQQVQFRLDNLALVVQADPLLTIFQTQLQDLRAVAASCDVVGMAPLVAALVSDLAHASGTTLQGVVIALAPNAPVTEPGVTVGADILVKNHGSNPATVSLSLAGLPGSVQSAVPGGSFVMGAGAMQIVPISLTPSDAGHFPFRAIASVTGAASSSEASGVLTAITAAVNVMSVVGSPPFILQNGTTRIRAIVANTVNIPLAAKALVTIKRSTGEVQYESSAPTLISIPVSNSTTTFDLDQITASGWPEDFYSVEVQLLNTGDTLIPGGQGAGSLPVATPIKASVSTDPILVPPGNSNVMTAINIEPRFAANGGGSIGLEPTDPSQDRINWAAASRGATISAIGPVNANIPVTNLINEQRSGTEHYFGTDHNGNGFFLLDLGDVRPIDALEFHIWDGDARVTRYLVESSVDGSMFSTLIDRTTGEHSGIQRLTFPVTSMRYIKIIGTFDSFDGSFFYLTDEILAIGESTASPVPTQTVTLNGATHSANNNPAVGPIVELNAGIYEIKHVSGAVSFYPNDGDNNGKTWGFKVNVTLPLVPKAYQLGYIHDSLSLFATESEAATAALGKSFKLYLPFHTKVFFWIHDPEPSGNRGTEMLEIRQLSGPNDSLPVRVRDAMMRSVLWEQPEVAGWKGFGTNKWIETANYDCFGCHVQTQGSYGLEASRQKLPELPVDQKLMDRFVDAYIGWQNTDGSTSSFNSSWTTQTSLAAWAMSRFTGTQLERLAASLMKSLDFLLIRQDPSGAWNADHGEARLYFDGTPSATHTAGNIEALAKILPFMEGKTFVPFSSSSVAVIGNEMTFPQNFGNAFEVAFTPVANVTGVRISISDTFAGNGNFVVSELEAFDGVNQQMIANAVANAEQSGYPVVETFNGIKNDNNDGWAYSPQDSRTTPAQAVWMFASPTTIDRLRLTQTYPNHQLKKLTVEFTTDATPSLTGNFTPVDGLQVVLFTADRIPLYRTALQNAAGALSAASWAYERNIRTAAQTILGLHAALPFLTGDAATAAQARIGEAEAFLRATQNADGSWNDVPADGDRSRALPTAQALEALLLTAQSSVDAAVIAGAEFLLATQLSEGSWQQPPGLVRRLASTTWVEIALPTIFENLSSLTVAIDHRVPTETGVLPVDNSFSPVLSSQQNSGGERTFHWDALVGGAGQTFSFSAQLQGMQPGEVRRISNGTTVHFSSVAGNGVVDLPELLVSARHILTLDPAQRTVLAGESATFTVTLENLLGATETFTLGVDGVPAGNVAFPDMVTLTAGEIRTLTLLIDTPLDSLGGEVSFTVRAQSLSGVADAVGGVLDITSTPTGSGDPITLGALAADVALVPPQNTAGQGTAAVYAVRVTNVGDAVDTYALSGTFPAGFASAFATQTVTVPPGLGNFRDVELRITPPLGTTPGSYSFSVHLVSTQDDNVQDNASGMVNVVSQGVDVDITPSSSGPGNLFQMTVTNTGQDQDTFDLALAGPVGVVSTLGASSITLNPGASQTVNITVGAIDVAFPGNLLLIGTATSQANPAVQDSDTAQVVIVSTQNMVAEFNPGTATLPAPGAATFLLLVHNMGNQEDAYKAEIMGTTGPITAALDDLNGQPTQTIETFRLPGISTGALTLKTTLTTNGRGEVNVKVTSLTNGAITDISIAVTQTSGDAAALDDFLCYRTRSSRGDLCAEDAPANAGGACELEADCGGIDQGNDDIEETDYCVPQKFPRGLRIAVVDRFTPTEERIFDLRKPINLCNPAEVDDDTINDPDTHLRAFQIRLTKGKCAVTAPQNAGQGCRAEEECGGVRKQTNLCEAQAKPPKQTRLTISNVLHDDQHPLTVDAVKIDRVFVPTAKSLTEPVGQAGPNNVDRYECARVRVTPKTRKFSKNLFVSVVDQFDQPKTYEVKRPTRLCTPIDLDGQGVKSPTQDLMCYQVRQVKGLCTAEALVNAGGVCKKESDCGGTRRETNFCAFQPKHQKVKEIHVNNEFLPELVDTTRTEDLCLPSQTTAVP